jgi:hypothetical protein
MDGAGSGSSWNINSKWGTNIKRLVIGGADLNDLQNDINRFGLPLLSMNGVLKHDLKFDYLNLASYNAISFSPAKTYQEFSENYSDGPNWASKDDSDQFKIANENLLFNGFGLCKTYVENKQINLT